MDASGSDLVAPLIPSPFTWHGRCHCRSLIPIGKEIRRSQQRCGLCQPRPGFEEPDASAAVAVSERAAKWSRQQHSLHHIPNGLRDFP